MTFIACFHVIVFFQELELVNYIVTEKQSPVKCNFA